MFSVSSSSSLSVFTNVSRQDEVGTYLVPVEFKDEQNNTNFTLLSASPNKACLNGFNFEGQQVSDDTVYLQQVDYECILDLQNAGNVLLVSKFIIAKPFFDWTTGQSFCELCTHSCQSRLFKHTSNYNQHSPNCASPKFNMFSQ